MTPKPKPKRQPVRKPVRAPVVAPVGLGQLITSDAFESSEEDLAAAAYRTSFGEAQDAAWDAVTVTMNDRFALQVSLLALWDNMPALEAIPLNGGPPTVLVELEEFDTVFTASLVVNFD